MRFRRNFAAVVLTFLGMVIPRPAAALGPDAAALAKEAKLLLTRGQTALACDKYAESVKLDPKSNVALELAGCFEKLGKPVLAYRTLDAAIAAAIRDKVGSVEKSARAKQKTLEKSVGFLTVTPRAGASRTLDGQPLDSAEFTEPQAIEPGDHLLAAAGAGKKPWEHAFAVKAGQRQVIEVPELADVPKPVVATPISSRKGAAPETGEGSAALEKAGRLVVEAGFLGGLAVGAIRSSRTSALNGVAYGFPAASGGTVLAGCGDTTTVPGAGQCEGDFHTHTGGMLGGQLFVGWAVAPGVHLGGRAFGGSVTPGGFVLAGGPALSLRKTGPFWFGLGAVIGYERQTAVLLSARGSVPADAQAASGLAEVEVPLGSKRGVAIDIDSGVLAGGTLEFAVSLLGLSRAGVRPFKAPTAALAGSMLIGVWPSVLVGSRGVVITAPVGISYRFH